MPRLIDADVLMPNAEYKGKYDTVNAYDIVNCPTVDAEPVKHGHWVRNDNGTYSCSKCHSWIPDEQHYYARYCLFRGAKMDEVEDGAN